MKGVAPLDKCYIDLSGRINEESVLHKFHYYCTDRRRRSAGMRMSRAMLDRAGMHIGWWYFAIRHAVLITNLVLLEAVEEGSAKATGKEERTTVWEAHFGVQPRLD